MTDRDDTAQRDDTAVLASRLKLKHLSLFNHVCAHRNLHRAASAASMTQPAATKLIQEMEDMFGVPLFERGRHGMALTHYGQALQRHVAVLLGDVATMRTEMQLMSLGAVGQVRLGVLPSVSSDLLAAAIAATRAAYPGMRFIITEAPASDLVERLQRSELDLTFGRVLDLDLARELEIIDVYDESFVIAARADHPLARRRQLTLEQLNGEPWILAAAGTPIRNRIDSLFTGNAALRPAVAVECNSFERMYHLIARTAMLGVLPRGMGLQGRAQGHLSVLRYELGANFAPVKLIFRKQAATPPGIVRFAQEVQAAARELRLV